MIKLTLLIIAHFTLTLSTHLQAKESPLEINVQDGSLQACLQSMALDNQWHNPQDFTKITCHSMGIKSLVGLALFKNIETLSLYNNNVTQLDIDLRHFPKLKQLNLARNNLKNFVLSDLKSLEEIYVFGSQIQILQLSNLDNLQILKANNNKIVNFTYTNTPQLRKIYIFDNKMETVNIYDLSALQYMDCRENPMPDVLYDDMDRMENITFLHDGNAEDW